MRYIQGLLRKYTYVWFPLISVILIDWIKPDISEKQYEILINISGILSGFLFTTLGILIALPQNRFTEFIRKYYIIKTVYLSIFSGIITFFLSIIIGFACNNRAVLYLTFYGISCTILSSFYLFVIGYFSSKSK